jgi:hypothetical protein
LKERPRKVRNRVPRFEVFDLYPTIRYLRERDQYTTIVRSNTAQIVLTHPKTVYS